MTAIQLSNEIRAAEAAGDSAGAVALQSVERYYDLAGRGLGKFAMSQAAGELRGALDAYLGDSVQLAAPGPNFGAHTQPIEHVHTHAVSGVTHSHAHIHTTYDATHRGPDNGHPKMPTPALSTVRGSYPPSGVVRLDDGRVGLDNAYASAISLKAAELNAERGVRLSAATLPPANTSTDRGLSALPSFAPGSTCPDCGTRQVGSERFCSNCGRAAPATQDPTIAAARQHAAELNRTRR